MESGLLEDWLQRAASSSPSTASSVPSSSVSPSAPQIAQAWAQVRECVQKGVLQTQHSAALSYLRDCGRTLHLVEPQARLLVSVLSLVGDPDGTGENAHALARARGASALLLSIWLRRGLSGRNRRAPSPAHQEIIKSVVSSTLTALESSSSNTGFVSEAILLLGTLCVAHHVQEEEQRRCQEAIVRECLRHTSVRRRNFREALAGVGYAMVSSTGRTLRDLVQALLSSWAGDESMDKPCLENDMLLLHLMEWYGTTQRQNYTSLQIVVEEIVEANSTKNSPLARCVRLLFAAGLLRSFHLRRLGGRMTEESAESSWKHMEQSLSSMITNMANDTVGGDVQVVAEEIKKGAFSDSAFIESGKALSATRSIDKHWLQCMALAMSRCEGFPLSVSVLLGLLNTFTEDVLPLRSYYDGTMSKTSGENEDALAVHVESILFTEAGAIFRVICEQYQSADLGWQRWTEVFFSQYSLFIYGSHSYFLARSDNRKMDGLLQSLPANDTAVLSKVLEAAFLSVVMFFAVASKQKMDSDMYTKGYFASRVIQALSCMEFIRQRQVPEYRELVQRCVAWVAASEATCTMLKYVFPSYQMIINPPGPSISSYNWMKDTVQDSRVLFGFRVLPSCLQTYPAASFLNEVAPTMFLYMKHPSQALVQASHSLLVSFLATKPKDTKGDAHCDVDAIKEQLSVRLVERTFEERPFLPHYDSFVTGVGAIARQLPAGSGAMKGCISSLSRRASEFLSCASMGDCSDQGEENDLETGKKLQTLLLHLILIVDVQVLPHLLQDVARLILGQRNPQRLYALEEAFDVLAGSDDLTRKHILVPWLQSLSYLCSNIDESSRRPPPRRGSSRRRKRRAGEKPYDSHADAVVAFNPSSAMIVTPEEDNADTSQVSRSRL